MIKEDILTYIYDIVVLATMSYSLYLYFWKKYTKKQRYFYIYITLIFLIDVFGGVLRIDYYHLNQFYFYFPLFIFTILYFGYFFIQDYKDRINRILLFFSTALALTAVLFAQIKDDYLVISPTTMLVIIIYQIVLSLQWFWYIVNHADEQNIIHKQAFWVSCALLIWSTFAIFRMYPMYDLAKMDKDFLSSIINVFEFVNIITYLLYIRGLRCTEYNILRIFNHF